MTDILEAQAKLKQNEQKYRTLAQNIDIPIYRYDKNFKRLYVNPAVERLTGKDASEFLGKTPLESRMVVPDYDEVLLSSLKKVFTTKQKDSVELLFMLPDGTKKYFMHNHVPEFAKDGSVESVLAIGHDITLQKQLLKKEEEFRTLAENSPNIIMRYDKECNRIYANPAFSVQTGIPIELTTNRKPDTQWGIFLDMINMTAQEYQSRVKNVIETGKSDYFSTEWIRNVDGEKVCHNIHIVVEKDEDDNVIGALAIGHNISKLKRANEKMFMQQFALDQMHDAVYLTDQSARFLYVNQGACDALGYTKEELVQLAVKDIDDTEAQWSYKDWLVQWDKIKKEKKITLELKHKRKNGTVFPVELKVKHFIYNNSEYTIAIARDLSKRKEYEKEILKQKGFQDTLLKGLAEAGLNLSVIEDGKFIYTNDQKTAKEYGYDVTNIAQTKPDILTTIHPDDKEKLMKMYKKRLAGEEVPSNYTIRVLRANGKVEEQEISAVLVPNTNPVQTIVMAKDITERKNIEKQIAYLAYNDSLTGLPNRDLARDRAKQLFLRAKRNDNKVAVLFIDLDGFKTINDSLGHAVGDEVLKAVAQRLTKQLRGSDTLSRHGGDEFLLFICDVVSIGSVIRVAQKIIKGFEDTIYVRNHSFSITASIGIAMYPDNGESYDHLLQKADIAMYEAKENGKNTYMIYEGEKESKIVNQLKIQSHILSGIKHDEFVLHYQPQIDLENKKMIGVESLIRWQHPTLGLLYPDSFIEIAESSGHLLQLGEWVLNEACKQGAIWNKDGKEMVIAVNISAIQFRRGELLGSVKKALNTSGLKPELLELEMTESIIMHNADNVLATIKEIKDLGVKLSLDDFGTGYSSLSYLKKFAIDKVKIDRSFVKDILVDEDDLAITKAIINMAKSLKLKTIAEGVETKEIAELLKEHGCKEVQGYYYAKPMEASQIQEFYDTFLM